MTPDADLQPSTPSRVALLDGGVRRLGAALLVVGVWGTLAPYGGPEVAVTPTLEFVDHVVPGIIVLAMAILSLQRGAFGLIPTSVAVLAGLWMTVTHIPLISGAARGETPWDGAIWMFTPSALLLALTGGAFAWALRHAADVDDRARAADPGRPREAQRDTVDARRAR